MLHFAPFFGLMRALQSGQPQLQVASEQNEDRSLLHCRAGHEESRKNEADVDWMACFLFIEGEGTPEQGP